MRRGFSLVELMVTVAVIGVLAVIAVPAVMESQKRREVADAAQAAQDFVEYGRVQAASRNRAYRLNVTVADGERAGSLVLWENTTSACTGFDDANNPARAVRQLVLGAGDFERFPRTRILPETSPTDLPNAPLCLKPDGRVYQVHGDTTPAIIPATNDMAGGDARIRFQRVNADFILEGPVHALVIPFNGLSRVVVE